METLLQQVARELDGMGYQTTVHDVPKVNGSKTGLSVAPLSGNVAPTFYEEHFLDMQLEGYSVKDMALQAIDIAEHGSPEFGDYSHALTSKEYLLENASLCVCNAEEWNNQEFLFNTPHERVAGTDLAEYVRVRVGESGSMVPSHTHLAMAQTTGEELLDAARKNSKAEYRCRSLHDVLQEMMGNDILLPPQEDTMPMVVISNTASLYGASAITDKETLEKARSMAGGGDCYVIPSSIHECLVIPAKIGADDVTKMIQEINANEVKPAERLGSHPYLYDGETLSEVRTKAQVQEQERSGRRR